MLRGYPLIVKNEVRSLEVCPLLEGCPFLRGSFIGGSDVIILQWY